MLNRTTTKRLNTKYAMKSFYNTKISNLNKNYFNPITCQKQREKKRYTSHIFDMNTQF